MVVYKVCHRLMNGTLVSAMAHSQSNNCGYSIVYDTGMETTPMPGCGPLTGFLYLPDAQEFLRRFATTCTNLTIFRARAKRSTKREIYCKELGTLPIENCPQGTILCDSITLVDKP